MRDHLDRRAFLRAASALAAGVALSNARGQAARAADTVALSTPSAEELGWKVSLEIYTFRSLPFYDALRQTADLGVRHVEPGFFLPLDSQQPGLTTSDKLTPPQRQEMKRRLADLGLSMPTYYADITSNRDAAVRAFAFAREMGVETIVAEPPHDAFDMIEKLCDEFALNLAVHNHPQSPASRYWHPERVLAVCRGRGPRIGACCDTGHWVRSGLRPLDCLKLLEGRIISAHLKDVGEWAKPDARDLPLGQGLAELGSVLEELKRQGFRRVLAVEYEHESPDLMRDVAECLAFIESTAARLV